MKKIGLTLAAAAAALFVAGCASQGTDNSGSSQPAASAQSANSCKATASCKNKAKCKQKAAKGNCAG